MSYVNMQSQETISDSSLPEDLHTSDDMGTPAQSTTIGSDLWLGADTYGNDCDIHYELIKFFDAVKWDALASIASRCRNGIPCVYSESYSVGHFNMVRRLKFSDGVSWVIKVRLPEKMSPTDSQKYDGVRAFEVEVAAMMFLRRKTSIPVPRVFAFDPSSLNEANVPYILMEYIHGTVATELREAKFCAPALFGTPDQDQRFREQMARIQAEVSLHRFPLIGGLSYVEETDSFRIGPDITGKGPWKSSMEYYRDLTNELLQTITTEYPDLTSTPLFSLPILLNYLMTLYADERAGPFRLVNRDFGAHNILVNDNFEIVGIIDFDGVMSAPIELVAQYPDLSGFDLDPPGHIETRPAAIERIKLTEHWIVSYKESLIKYEMELCKDSVPVGYRLRTTPALLMLGYLDCNSYVQSDLEMWFKAALLILKEYEQKGSCQSFERYR